MLRLTKWSFTNSLLGRHVQVPHISILSQWKNQTISRSFILDVPDMHLTQQKISPSKSPADLLSQLQQLPALMLTLMLNCMPQVEASGFIRWNPPKFQICRLPFSYGERWSKSKIQKSKYIAIPIDFSDFPLHIIGSILPPLSPSKMMKKCPLS